MSEMSKSELRRMVRDEIRLALQVISSGAAGDNSSLTGEDIQSLFAGLPTLPARPIMRPYGFFSRAPAGTIQVTAQQGEHPGNKLTLGHRDNAPPDFAELGESVMYSVGGYQIYVGNTSISIGKDGVFQTAGLGNALATLVNSLIAAITSHTHMFNYSAGSTPSSGTTQTLGNQGDFTSLKTSTFLAEDGEGE